MESVASRITFPYARRDISKYEFSQIGLARNKIYIGDDEVIKKIVRKEDTKPSDFVCDLAHEVQITQLAGNFSLAEFPK